MLQQYVNMKNQHPECLLFFRVGDFYEWYFQDAHLLHQVLDLAVSDKSKNKDWSIPMAGIPHHALDKYIPRLIQHWYKIAIAEQMTEAMPGKLVDRQITQIITPWTYITESAKIFNYILSITQQETQSWLNFHVAWGDFTIGEYWTKSFKTLDEVEKRVAIINPREIILDADLNCKDDISDRVKTNDKAIISIYEVPNDPDFFLINLCKIQNLKSFWIAVEGWRLKGITLLLNYIKHTQTEAIQNIYKISFHSSENRVFLDDITIKNLEIFTSSYQQETKYTLCEVLDHSRTSAGARFLRYLLLNPTKDLQVITARHGHILRFQTSPNTTDFLRILRWTFDVSKLISTILYRKLTPITFVKLRSTLWEFFDESKPFFRGLQEELAYFGLANEQKNQISSLFDLLHKALKDADNIGSDLNFIADGYSEAIDQLRKIAYHSDELIYEYQLLLAERSGLTNVKLKFIMNEWYFIEIAHKDSVNFKNTLEKLANDDSDKFTLYHRKTLKDSYRFTTPYLENIASTILSAQWKLQAQEFAVLWEIKEKISLISPVLAQFAQMLAQFDVFASHARFAIEKDYTQPLFVAWWWQSGAINITNARHPVIEEFLAKDQQFIPNDLVIEDGNIHIITWPNMGWKSTYLRQSALILLLAHCGLFVPASKAKIPLVDGIFARIGSGDIIAKNQSTFMTEMIEVSNILNNATSNSFIIFDELGRGTSTYDGIALTKAILTYILTNVKAKTLLATHYHELIDLENTYPEVKNFSVSVYETDKEVIFTKKIIKGWANKSYWIDVAQLAWISRSIIENARNNLANLESNKKNTASNQTPLFNDTNKVDEKQINNEKVASLIKATNLDNVTPLQALQLLMKMKEGL